MNRIRNIKQVKFNNSIALSRAKSNVSTISISNSTKYSSKVHLSEIFMYMDSIYPLSDLAELIEKETGGKFTQLTFREIIDKIYPELTISDKIFLIKHIPLSKVGITPYSPLIFILYLFKYIQSITQEKIYSPSLIFYSLADKLQYSHGITTIDFFQKLGLEPNMEIKAEEFYLDYGLKLGLGEIENIILFKSIDYNKDGKIKIEDLILVIDSYRYDNLNERYYTNDISMQNDVNLLKIFLEKNFITIDIIYEDAEYNYMTYIDLKSFLVNEIYNYKRFSGNEDIKINETIVDNVLSAIKRNEKIFKNDFKNYLGEFIFNKKSEINDTNNVINLNEKQKYWINKYIDIINSAKMTPKMIFDLAAKDNNNNNVANIIELMRHVIRLIQNGKLNSDEIQYIINALDINKTGLIEVNQYEIIINSIEDIKNNIKKKMENDLYGNGKGNEKIINMWSKGIKSDYYHLLPAKGNYDILENINQDIKNNIIFDEKEKENDINANNIDETSKKKIKKNNFLEQKIGGDMGAIYEEVNEKTGKVETYYTNDKDLAVGKIENLNSVNDVDYLKIVLENYNFEDIFCNKEDLLSHLIKNKIEQKMAEETVKYLDNNDNGQISIINLFKFLFYELKYKSTKLVLKYLYLKIYKELKYDSSITFFENNKFKPQKVIRLNKLINFFEKFYIDAPLTQKLYENIEFIYKSPIIYAHLCQLIDYSKFNSKIIDEKETDENVLNIVPLDINKFDKEIKNIVRNLIDVDEFNNTDKDRCNDLTDKIDEMLSNLDDDNITYNQYIINFTNKLNMSQSTQDSLFNILKCHSKKGDNQQVISKKDLKIFLESYACEDNDIYNHDKHDKEKNEENEGLSITKLKNIIKKIEEENPPLKYAFECIPFRCNGLISSTELLYILNSFYKNSISKKILVDIISCIDEEKEGFISFTQLQLFLNNFSEENNFSPILELEIIATKLYSKNITNVTKYFKKNKNIKNMKEIRLNEHKKILKNLCSNINNNDNLYKYMTNENNNSDYYNIKNLINKINFFLVEKNEELILEQNELYKKEEEDEEENLGMPNIQIVENSLKLINLGQKGFVSIYELIMKMKKGYRKSFSEAIDKNKTGYISFPDLIKKLRKIYGTEINLNYKLCAQYLFKAYILVPKQAKNYILKKSNQKNINTYLDKKDIYNNFMFAFCNDKFLFENFYNVYCEKKGKYKNKLNLNSLLLFIYTNNPELKSYENNLRFNNDNKDKIDLSNKKIIIADILEKKLTNVREIIEKINFKSSKLQKNFSISEKYIKSLLITHFNFNDDETDELCNHFQSEEGKFDLKAFFEFDPKNERNIPIILEDDVIPRIQNHIMKSIYKSYKEYKRHLFKNDFLDICELYLIFNELYNLSLYHCLVIIIGYKEQYLNLEKFFKETNLKNSFPSKELEPALILAIIRLNEFIEEKYKNNKSDKLKIFKGFDTNKDGILSTEEFFNALNSIEGLNLNENQKHKLYNFADSNNDGKINASEFLNLIKNVKNYLNDEDEMNAPLPASWNNKNINEEKKFIPKVLEKDISVIKTNYKYNTKKIKNLKKNNFLSSLVKLQLDLIDNYYSFECMENDFLTADKNNEGYVSGKMFKIILQKRIINIDDKIVELFIKFSEDDDNKEKEEDENEEEEDDESKNKVEDIRNKKVNYKIFLNKLAEHKINEIKKEEN